MSGTSSVTVAVAFRIPVEVAEVADRRVAKAKGKWANRNEYIKERAIYDLTRKHNRRNE